MSAGNRSRINERLQNQHRYGSAGLVEPWQVYDLNNTELQAQQAIIEQLSAPDATPLPLLASAALKELSALVEEEMKERGVAYTLGARLQSLVSTHVVINDHGASHVDASGASAARDSPRKTSTQPIRVNQRFEELLGVRPPWFVDSNEVSSVDADDSSTTLATPPPRRGLWDREDASSEDTEDDDVAILRKKRERRGSRRQSHVGVMNKLGFFVVPSSKRRVSKATAPAAPLPVAKKPAVPTVTRKALPPLGASAHAKVAVKTAPLNHATLPAKKAPTPQPRGKLPPVQPQRSATAVPFEGGRVLLEMPVRPASAELATTLSTGAATSAEERTVTIPNNSAWSEDEQSKNLEIRVESSSSRPQTPERHNCENNADGLETRSPRQRSEDAGDNMRTSDSTQLPMRLIAEDIDPRSPHVEASTDGGNIIEVNDNPPPSPHSTISLIPGTPMEGVVVSATLVDKGISTAPHGHKLEEGSDVTNNTVTGKILRAPSNSCVGSIQPSISHALTAALLPPRSPPLPKLQPISEVRPAKVALFCDPSYPSLESMMIDPTYFFSFETQPIEVRLQSYRMMKHALEAWLQISVPASLKSQMHSSRLRLPSTPIPKATQSNEDEDEERRADADELKRDTARWYYCQTSHEEVYELVTGVLESMEDSSGLQRPWRETPHALFTQPRTIGSSSKQASAGRLAEDGQQVPNCWNLWWTWGKPRVQQRAVWLLGAQYVNHIPRSWHLTKKDSLKSNVQRYLRRGTTSGVSPSSERQMFEIVPPSFALPKEYVAFASCFAETRGTWIMKTVGMSRGRGISLVSDIADVIYDAPVVVQRYIDRPLTVDGGFKFDLRIYVLVTSFQPRLEAFVSTLGFARIAAYRYQATDLSNVYAHLTNTSVSGAARKEDKSRPTHPRGPPRVDTKWTLDRLAADVNRRGKITWDQLWSNIKNVILKTLVCVEDNIPAAPCTFELFGFDVLIDEDYTPWILEVNASPSLEVDCSEDEEVKPQLIEDIVRLIDIAPVDRHALLAALNRRLGVHDAVDGVKKPLREKVSWADEFQSIFCGWTSRPTGDDPLETGNFERLAPSPAYSQLHKAKRAL